MRYIKVWKVLHGDIYLILATQQRPEKKETKMCFLLLLHKIVVCQTVARMSNIYFNISTLQLQGNFYPLTRQSMCQWIRRVQ